MKKRARQDDVIVITISSGLSGTYQSAAIAANDYPGRVYVIDSLSATAGEQVLIEWAIKLRDEGKSAAEIFAELDEMRKKARLFVRLETLEYLKRGGRISKTSAAVGGLLNIKPILTLNGEGKLVGINSMKIASTEYEGMGFAVPSSVMIDVFNSIIENGYVAGRAKLGIQYATPSNYSQTYAMYVQMKGLPTGTIVIASVSEDSDLADKDVKEGDMIIAVNGKEMTHSDMLADMIEDMSAGDTLTLTIVRVNTDDWSQTEREVTVKLVEDTGASGAQTPETNEDSGSGSMPYGDDYQDWYEFFKDFYGY